MRKIPILNSFLNDTEQSEYQRQAVPAVQLDVALKNEWDMYNKQEKEREEQKERTIRNRILRLKLKGPYSDGTEIALDSERILEVLRRSDDEFVKAVGKLLEDSNFENLGEKKAQNLQTIRTAFKKFTETPG